MRHRGRAWSRGVSCSACVGCACMHRTGGACVCAPAAAHARRTAYGAASHSYAPPPHTHTGQGRGMMQLGGDDGAKHISSAGFASWLAWRAAYLTRLVRACVCVCVCARVRACVVRCMCASWPRVARRVPHAPGASVCVCARASCVCHALHVCVVASRGAPHISRAWCDCVCVCVRVCACRVCVSCAVCVHHHLGAAF